MTNIDTQETDYSVLLSVGPNLLSLFGCFLLFFFVCYNTMFNEMLK
jgi:hypothetical protein